MHIQGFNEQESVTTQLSTETVARYGNYFEQSKHFFVVQLNHKNVGCVLIKGTLQNVP